MSFLQPHAHLQWLVISIKKEWKWFRFPTEVSFRPQCCLLAPVTVKMPVKRKTFTPHTSHIHSVSAFLLQKHSPVGYLLLSLHIVLIVVSFFTIWLLCCSFFFSAYCWYKLSPFNFPIPTVCTWFRMVKGIFKIICNLLYWATQCRTKLAIV